MEAKNKYATNAPGTNHKFQIAKMAGGYRLGKGIWSWKLDLEHTPRWFHRTMMKIFFGVVWEPNE